MIFDTHAHYDDEAFEEDREELFTQMEAAGIGGIVNVGASVQGVRASQELAESGIRSSGRRSACIRMRSAH